MTKHCSACLNHWSCLNICQFFIISKKLNYPTCLGLCFRDHDSQRQQYAAVLAAFFISVWSSFLSGWLSGCILLSLYLSLPLSLSLPPLSAFCFLLEPPGFKRGGGDLVCCHEARYGLPVWWGRASCVPTKERPDTACTQGDNGSLSPQCTPTPRSEAGLLGSWLDAHIQACSNLPAHCWNLCCWEIYSACLGTDWKSRGKPNWVSLKTVIAEGQM